MPNDLDKLPATEKSRQKACNNRREKGNILMKGRKHPNLTQKIVQTSILVISQSDIFFG